MAKWPSVSLTSGVERPAPHMAKATVFRTKLNFKEENVDLGFCEYCTPLRTGRTPQRVSLGKSNIQGEKTTMKQDPIIAKIEVHEFEWQLKDIGLDPTGAIPTYRPGDSYTRRGRAVRILTDVGIIGEFAPAGAIPRNVSALIGRSALDRERIYRDLKLAGTAGMGSMDVALWDIAGKFYDAPIYKLLGCYRTKLPCYASTMNGADEGALSTPESFADFAQQCLELGYPAFKIHPWPGGPIRRHVDVVRAARQRVGSGMDLMLDPFCYYETFGEALKVGRACDEAEFFWLEDPYADGGVSHSGHRKLRELIRPRCCRGKRSPAWSFGST